MPLDSALLKKAIAVKIITATQAKKLLQLSEVESSTKPLLNFTNTLYYFGGILAIGALTLFLKVQWESLGTADMLVLLISYGFLALVCTHHFARRNLYIPAGISATFALCLIPLLIYTIQKGVGWWPPNSAYNDYFHNYGWNRLIMEMGTLLGGIVLLWIYRYPFMLMPLAITLWFLSMDTTNIISGGSYDYGLAATVSLFFGFSMIALAVWVDIGTTSTNDYAFWLYLFGVITFWGGLGSYCYAAGWGRAVFFLINLLLIIIGVALVRKVFIIFGALGAVCYISYLAYSVFQHAILFPFILVIIGLMVIYLGILWQKYELKITAQLQLLIPTALRKLSKRVR
jgi:hypothetical protein